MLLCHSTAVDRVDDVKAKLVSSGLFAGVDLFDCGASTPDAASLALYRSILVWSGGPFANAAELGNNLVRVTFLINICCLKLTSFFFKAGFADGNRTVVVAYGSTLSSQTLGGRFASDSYMALTTGTNAAFTQQSLGTRAVPSSSLLAGVASFEGESILFCCERLTHVDILLYKEDRLVFERIVHCKLAPLSLRAGAMGCR